MPRWFEFEMVGLSYGRTRSGPAGPEVLHDLSFVLPDGAFRWLLGPSGAGKTSLLRLMYLDVRPTRGRLNLLGVDVERAERRALPRLRRRIGVVFQDFRLLPHLSAFDNVALPLRIAGRPEGQLRADVTRDAALGRAGAEAGRAARRVVGWRAAAGGHRPGGDRPAQPAAGGRAHRQPGRRAGRAADAAVQGAEPAGHHGGGRHAQRQPGRAATPRPRCGWSTDGCWGRRNDRDRHKRTRSDSARPPLAGLGREADQGWREGSCGPSR